MSPLFFSSPLQPIVSLPIGVDTVELILLVESSSQGLIYFIQLTTDRVSQLALIYGLLL